MARFNKKQGIEESLDQRPDATTNYEGGLAFKPSDELDLYLRAVSSFLSDKFYRTETAELVELQELARRVDRKFLLGLAAYVRNVMNIRTLPQILLAEAAAKDPKQPRPDVRTQATRIMLRADEPGEVLAYYRQFLGRKIPMALRRGIRDVLNKTDGYAFKKYEKGAMSQRLIVQLLHPDPRKSDNPKEQSALYRSVLDRTLPSIDTWETVISVKGSTAEAWNEVAPQMGIFALLRNLRNFEEKRATKAIDIAVQAFTDPERVLKSRILPFRWYEASKHVRSAMLQDALRDALEISVGVLPRFQGPTAILVDGSGSMTGPLSRMSKTTYAETAGVLGAIALQIIDDDVDVWSFSEDARQVHGLSRRDSVLSNAYKIIGKAEYAGTYAAHAINQLAGKHYDRVIMISDMQCYGRGWSNENTAGAWTRYRHSNGPSKLYSIDMAGYGTLQFPEDDKSVVLVGGFSEHVFDIIKAIDDSSTVVEEIKKNWVA